LRYKFLLDLNVIYDAVRGVDRQDDPDQSAVRLLDLMAVICHGITIHTTLIGEYLSRLNRLKLARPTHLDPVGFIKQFIVNSAKRNFEYDNLAELPAGVTVPREDEHLVRAALISHPIVVTEDTGLHAAINSHPSLALRALTIKEALDFVVRERERESPS
jgi:predicted nucleic acid-binding protein